MRSGRLLAEESPNNLLRAFRRPSLEDAFLKLCMDEQRNESIQANVSNEMNTEVMQQFQGGHENVDYNEDVVRQIDITEARGDGQLRNNGRGSIDSTTSSSGVRKNSAPRLHCFIIL